MDPSDEPLRERSRGIYLLPNLLTTGGLFSGFYAILAAASGNFENACIAVLVAALFDGLDGRVARLTGTTSEFGVQYDSLADLVSFGMAPSLVMYHWALVGFRAGHYRLRNWQKAFALLTRRERVLALSERGGMLLLLSLERPQQLIDDLRAAAARP